MLKKELSMTINEFMQVQRGEMTYKELYATDTILKQIGRRGQKLLVFTLGALMMASEQANATVKDPTKAATEIGWEMLRILQTAGLWICIIGCIIEILLCVFKRNGGKDEILSIVFKWFLILLAIFLVPAAFMWIAEYFKA